MPRRFTTRIAAATVVLAAWAPGCRRADSLPAVAPATEAPPPAAAPASSAPAAPLAAPARPPDVTPLVPHVGGTSPPAIGSGHFNGHHEAVVIRRGARVLGASPDGRFAATARQVSRSGALLQVREVATKQIVCERYEPLGVAAAAFDPAGRTLAYGAGDHTLVMQPVPSGEPSRWSGHRLSVTGLSFSEDGRWLASFGGDGRLLVWDVPRAAVAAEVFDPDARSARVKFTAPATIWTQRQDSVVRSYDFTSNELLLHAETKPPVDSGAPAGDGKPDAPVDREPAVAEPVAADVLNAIALEDDRQEMPPGLGPGSAGATAPPRFSPDGGTLIAWNGSTTVLVAEIATGLTRRRLPRPVATDGAAPTVTVLRGGRRGAVFCGVSAGGLEILNPESPPATPRIALGAAAVTAIAESPDERLLLAGDADGFVTWIEQPASAARKSEHRHARRVNAAEFSPDGRWAATAGRDAAVILWDAATRLPRHTLRGHSQPVQAVAFSRDSQWLASGDEKGTVTLWNVATGAPAWSATLREALVNPETSAALPVAAENAAEGSGIVAIAFSPDQRVLAVGTATGFTQTFDLEHRTELSPVLQGQAVSDLAFAADGASLLVATRRGEASRWWRAPDPPRLLPGHQGSVRFAALDASGRRAVTGGVDRQLKIWDVDRGTLVRSLDNGGEAITTGALSPDGQRAVTCGYGSGLMFRDLAAMSPPVKRYGHKKRVWALAFAPGGETVASGSDDQTVRIWSFATQKTIHTLAHDALVRFVRFSPDGKQLLTSTVDPRGWQFPARLMLWDAETGKPVRELPGHRMTVNSAVFSPDGQEITSCGADGQVCRWKAATGERLSDKSRPHGLSHAGLLRDGRCLVMRRFNDGVFVDLAETMTRLSEFDVPTRSIGDLGVAPQGNRIIAGTEEGPVYVWSLGHE